MTLNCYNGQTKSLRIRLHSNLGHRAIYLKVNLTLYVPARHICDAVPKFDFNSREDHQKISYERHDYESVDEKSIFHAMSRKIMKKIRL